MNRGESQPGIGEASEESHGREAGSCHEDRVGDEGNDKGVSEEAGTPGISHIFSGI